MAIEAALTGVLGRDPELKTSQAGKPWTRVSLAVVHDKGSDAEATTWVSVACFGEVAEKLCSAAKKGMKVYAEGTLKLGEWTDRTGEKRLGLQLAAWHARVVGAGALGKNKPPRKKDTGHQRTVKQPSEAVRHWQRPPAGAAVDAEIPFAPEVR